MVAYAVAMPASGGPGAGGSAYERLDPSKVTLTLTRLHARITATFPGRHLAEVAIEVRDVVDRIERQLTERAPWWRAVRILSRLAIVLLLVLIGVALVSAIRTGITQTGDVKALDWLQIVESGVNDVVFAGLAIYFLVSVPSRIRRNRTLEILHRLRSLAHIVDMHQMNKDPDELLPPREGGRGGIGGADRMTRAELGRYYDFCSELLSLTSKAAALCAEESADAIVLDTVSEIENLTTGMSRKIWQKISLLRTSTPLA